MEPKSNQRIKNKIKIIKRPEKTPVLDIFQLLSEYSIFIILLVTPLIFYPKIQDFSFLPKSTFAQLLTCIVWIIWILKSFQKKRLLIIKHPILLAITAWILWSGISIFWSINKYSAITLWLHWFISVFAFMVTAHIIKGLQKIDRLIFFGVMGAGIVSILGIVQFIWGLEIVPQAAVPAATFFNPNLAAQYIALMVPFSIMLFISSTNKLQTWLTAGFLGLMLVFTYYAKTRAAWLAILISLFFIVLFISITKSWGIIIRQTNKQKIIPLSLLIIFVIVLFNMPPHMRKESRTKSSSQIIPYPKQTTYQETIKSLFYYQQGTIAIRIAMWLNSVQMVKDHPLLGVGLGNWYIHYPLYHSALKDDKAFSLDQQPTRLHNTFLQLLAETSIVGVLLFISIFFIFFRRFFHVYSQSNNPDIKVRLLFILMTITCFLVNSLFTFPLRRAMPPLILMVTLALFVILETLSSRDPRYLTLFKSKNIRTLIILSSLMFIAGLAAFNTRTIIADGHLLKSIFYNHDKCWQAAKQEAEKAIRFIPWRHQVWYELSVANHSLGNYEEAIVSGLKSLQFHPNLINSYLNLSQIYLKKGDFSNAQKQIQKALDIKPDCAEVVFTLGLIKEKQSLITAAMGYFTRAIAIDKKNAKAHFHLAIIYYRQGKFSQAQEYFQQTILLNPHLIGPHYYLGLICSQQKKWDQAIPFYKDAIRKNPKSGIAHVNIAVAYFYLKEHDAALHHLKIGKRLKAYQADIVLKKFYPRETER